MLMLPHATSSLCLRCSRFMLMLMVLLPHTKMLLPHDAAGALP